jgi:pimeloyl-ACP methyl ester carboxylesterase
MRKLLIPLLLVLTGLQLQAQDDLARSKESPAGFRELQLPSAGTLLQGFMYKANGKQSHPTLLMLHGYPGNERNLDLAQAVRAHGWNVIYFNYRGSWGSQGEFSFQHCVEDVGNIITYLKQNAVKLEIDTSRIALFGHSMGGFVCLQALRANTSIKKGFAVSAWDIYRSTKDAVAKGKMQEQEKEADGIFVLKKASGKALFDPVLKEPAFFDLDQATTALAGKQIYMLDEHNNNKTLASIIQKANHNYFHDEVWDTDHSFTNKRGSLIKTVIAFLDKP